MMNRSVSLSTAILIATFLSFERTAAVGQETPVYDATIGSQFEISAIQSGLQMFSKKPTVYVVVDKSHANKKKQAKF